MIKKLRRKFIAITMCSIAVVLGIIIGIINILNYYQINQQAEVLLTMLSDNAGRFPEPDHKSNHYHRDFKREFSPEAPFTTRYFNVALDQEGMIISVNTGKIAAISTRIAAEYAKELFQKGKKKGFLKDYKYNKIEYDENIMYIFLDCSSELSTFYSFLLASIIVSLFGMLLVFLLVFLFSKIIVKPIAEGYEKQKRFITDASHEIKTPLAIIDANTEVLEMEQGENEWTTSIKKQVRRLGALTEKLVFLSKMDEETISLPMEEFSLSKLIFDMAKSFEAVAQAQEKTLQLEIEQNVFYYGNESSFRQLLSVLLDNAVKYSNVQGRICLSLHRLEKKLELTIKNTVDTIPQGNLDILFERFYRLDSSRNSETGGYGLGLSAAKAIIAVHKGKITAWSDDGKTISFLIVLPANVHK